MDVNNSEQVSYDDPRNSFAVLSGFKERPLHARCYIRNTVRLFKENQFLLHPFPAASSTRPSRVTGEQRACSAYYLQ